MESPEEEAPMVKEKLVSSYKKLESEVKEIDEQHWVEDVSAEEEEGFGRWSTTWCQQFCILLKRGIKERKHESYSALKVGQVLAVAFICGLLWWQSDISHLQDKVFIYILSLLYFSLIMHASLIIYAFSFPFSFSIVFTAMML